MTSSGVIVRVEHVSAERIIDLRHAVLRAGLPREAAHFDGDDEATAVHLAGIDDEGGVVGCVTLIRRPLPNGDDTPAWQLRGMAVAAQRQNAGVGRRLLDAAHAHVDGHLPRLAMWCNARVPAAGFYARHGWRVVSDVFEIATAGPHVRMMRDGGAEPSAALRG